MCSATTAWEGDLGGGHGTMSPTPRVGPDVKVTLLLTRIPGLKVVSPRRRTTRRRADAVRRRPRDPLRAHGDVRRSPRDAIREGALRARGYDMTVVALAAWCCSAEAERISRGIVDPGPISPHGAARMGAARRPRDHAATRPVAGLLSRALSRRNCARTRLPGPRDPAQCPRRIERERPGRAAAHGLGG
jgi:hypothetical protein